MIRPVPPIHQGWYDDNRQRFEADSTNVSNQMPGKCQHYFQRVNSTSVECRNCRMGWIDLGRWKVENGKIS